MARKFQVVRGEGEQAQRAELLIYDVIGADPWTGQGVTAPAVLEAIEALSGIEALDVRLNSPGGEVSEGVAIYNALSRFSGRVVVHVDALAASIASLIAMAGDEIRTAENALWMLHQPWTVVVGDAPECRRVADTLDRYWASMLATYSRRIGLSGDEITQRVTAAGGEWWLTAAEALEVGLTDVVAAPAEDVKAYGLDRFRRVPAAIAASAEPHATRSPRFATANATAERIEISAPRRARPASSAAGPDEDREHRIRRLTALRLRG